MVLPKHNQKRKLLCQNQLMLQVQQVIHLVKVVEIILHVSKTIN